MADQQAKFVLTLEGKDDQLTSLFAAFKRQVRSDVSEIERATSNLKLFANLDADVKKAATSVDFTRAAVASLGRTIENLRGAGEPVGKDLEKAFAQAQRAAASAEKQFISQSQALDKLRVSLTAAGVDTTNLAAAEVKLAAASKLAAAAAAEQAAKQATGFKTLRDIAPEVAKVRDGYNLLASSGKLSFAELSTLHARASLQIRTLNEGVSGLSEGFKAVRSTVIGFAVAFAGVGVAIASSTKNFLAFSTQIAAIDTIADVSKARIAQLEAGVSSLSRTMGVDAVNSAKALYDIIGSGIPADNALQVLALSTQAARAGLTDVGTAAKAGVAVLNGFGLQANQLEHVLDVMFQTVRDGVITFKEIGDNIGNVIPIARAAGVSVEEVGAAFSTLTAKSGINAPEAATSIARAIQDLAAPAPEAAAKMRELGISFNGLLGTIKQFSKLNLSLDEISKIIPDIRAAKGVLALAQNFEFLNKQVDEASTKGGQMKAAYDIMAATPQFQIDRLTQSIADLSRTIGKVVVEAALPLIRSLADMLEAFNKLSPATKQTTAQVVGFTVAVSAAVLAVRALAIPINLLVGAFGSIGALSGSLTTGLTAAAVAMRALGVAVAFFVGFKIGEFLREASANIRHLGDVLGLVLAAFVALGKYVADVFVAIFSGNFLATLSTLTDKLVATANALGSEFVAALFGTTRAADEASRASQAFKEKIVALGTAASDAAAKVTEAVSAILAKLGTELAQVETRINTTTAALSALVADLQKQVAAVSTTAGSLLANLAAQTAQALSALQSIDTQRITDTIEIQRKAATERLEILKKFGEDALAAFQKEADARLAIAQKSKINIKQVEQDILDDKRAKLQEIVDKYRAHVDELLSLQRAHLEKIRELETKRRDIAQDIDAQIREIQRQSLTAYQAYSDKVREIDELLAKARLAAAQGQDKIAEQFAQKAVGLVNGISTAVKEEGEEVVSQSRATSNATDRLTEAKRILLGVNEKNLAAEKAGAQAAADGLKEALPLLQQYTQQLKEVQEKAAEGIKVKITADTTAVTKELETLAEDIAKKDILVPLIANLKDLDEKIEAKRKDLEKGIPVTLTAETEQLTAAIKKVQDERPELKVLTDEAVGKVADLRSKLQALQEVVTNSQHTVTSNVDDVRKDIDTLKQPTESTHTVHVVVDNPAGVPVSGGAGGSGSGSGGSGGSGSGGFARGGAVRGTGGAGQRGGAEGFAPLRFARGGAVGFALGGEAEGEDATAFAMALNKVYGDLITLLSVAVGVPQVPATEGTNLADWVREVLGKFFQYGVGRQKQIRDFVASHFDDWLSAVEEGRRTNSPVLVDDSAKKIAFARGGRVRHFARGGFAGAKVPGTGSGDIVPTTLQSGQFVVRRAASRFYGDGIMGALAGVKRFASGGGVGGVNPIAQRILLGSKSRTALGGTGLEEFQETLDRLYELQYAARSLPHSSVGLDISEWAARIIDKFPLFDQKRREQIKNVLEDGFDGWMAGIESARKFHVPAVMEFGVASLAFRRGGPIPAILEAIAKLAHGGRSKGRDTVRAMVEPGEFIVSRPAVQRFGSRFMEAVNRMAVPREALARMVAPPAAPVAYFAQGGQVGPPVTLASRGGVERGGNTFNFHAGPNDILTPRNILNYVVPVLRDLDRKSK